MFGRIRSEALKASQARNRVSWELSRRTPVVISSAPSSNEGRTFELKRSFHGTAKKEVLPVIAVGAVLMIGRYSWKALNRMDEEWEDYNWQMQQYERQRRKDETDANAPVTIGVDLGTFYLKLASMSGPKPELIPTAQGDRYRFAGLLRENKDSWENVVVGRPALEKFFYQGEEQSSGKIDEPVVLPYREIQKYSDADATDLLQSFVLPTVGEAMEKVGTVVNERTSKSVRTVLTLPPVLFNQNREGIFHQNYHDNSHKTITVPDPVAAVWGAQSMDLLPTPSTKEDVENTLTLVVDVGGLATSISLVKKDRVIGSSCLDKVGGETLVQLMVQRILKEADDETLANDPTALAMIHTSARSSVLELVQKTQTSVHIPFLFMGRKPDNPHFETTVSRVALEQAAHDHLATVVAPDLLKDGELSSSMPTPANASMLLTSAVTKVLEESGQLPTDIQHILLVGGGARFNVFEKACEEGTFALMGPSPQKLVLPEQSLRAELTAVGAASLLPNYDYDYDKGLERVN